jgi:hypothetical protein
MNAPTLVGADFNDAKKRELQDWLVNATNILDKLATSGSQGGLDPITGITTPAPIQAGAVGEIGDPGLGVAPILHEHPVPVGPPTGLGNANAEGSSTQGVRKDHVHKRDVRVLLDGADVGTRNGVSFSSADFAVTDNGGADRVDVALAASPSTVAAAAAEASARRWIALTVGT